MSSERVVHDTCVDHTGHPAVVGVPVAPVVGTRVLGCGGISAVHSQMDVSNRNTNNNTNVIVVPDDPNVPDDSNDPDDDIDDDDDYDDGDEKHVCL